MPEPDFNNLRRILDEYERYASSLNGGDQGEIARQIADVVAEARAALHPSPDSTANFLDTKQVVERLAALRSRAESSAQ